jgi:hypothetical protein
VRSTLALTPRSLHSSRNAFLTAGLDQPHQKAGKGKSAEHHAPVAAVELKEPAVWSNFGVWEHGLSAANNVVRYNELSRRTAAGCYLRAT